MSDDEFLDGLRGDWQSRVTPEDTLADAVTSGENRLRRDKRARLGSVIGYFGLMLLFFYLSRTQESPLFHLGAVAFLVAFLLTLGDFILLRRVTGADFMGDASSLLEKAERQAQSALYLTRGALAAAVLLGVCAIFAAIYAVTGFAEPLFATVMAVVWAASGYFALLQQRAASARALAELEQVRAMRVELASME